MKKFSRILQYLSKYRGKLVIYLVFTLLSTLFGLISLGMLSPFLSILFKSGESDTQKAFTISGNAVGSLKTVIENIVNTHGAMWGLALICVLILLSTILKNVFYYWSSYLSSP